MQEKIQEIYRSMLSDADSCWQSGNTELEKIEQCFRLAIRHWYSLRDEFVNYTFKSKEEEIDFFKNVKPLFTGRIEFYTIAYKAILFKPEDNDPRLKSFWKEEAKKQQVFKKENEDFINYYKSGDTSLDEQYFLRIPETPASRAKGNIGPELQSSHDYMVSAILAQKLYHAYVKMQLKKLGDA